MLPGVPSLCWSSPRSYSWNEFDGSSLCVSEIHFSRARNNVVYRFCSILIRSRSYSQAQSRGIFVFLLTEESWEDGPSGEKGSISPCAIVQWTAAVFIRRWTMIQKTKDCSSLQWSFRSDRAWLLCVQETARFSWSDSRGFSRRTMISNTVRSGHWVFLDRLIHVRGDKESPDENLTSLRYCGEEHPESKYWWLSPSSILWLTRI